MIFVLDFDTYSPFLPKVRIPLGHYVISDSLRDKLKEIVLNEEQSILAKRVFNREFVDAKTQDKLEYDWITNRAYEYNLFDYTNKYPELNDFKQFISESYRDHLKNLNIPDHKVYIHCWVNILKKTGKFITPHHHCTDNTRGDQEYAWCSGHICITANNTCTHYQHPLLDARYNSIKNNPGDMFFFPSYITHWTDKNEDDEYRISIAFDLIPEEVYENGNVVNKKIFIEL